MNYRIYSSILLLISTGIVACAQEKSTIKSVQLFSQVQIPGNIPVNEKGEPMMGPDTVYTIIAETTGKPVQWSTASTKSKTYSVASSVIQSLPYDAGTEDATGKRMLLSPVKGNQLWLLQLTPLETKMPGNGTIENGNIMLLQGKTGNKRFSHTIRQQTAIRTLPVY